VVRYLLELVAGQDKGVNLVVEANEVLRVDSLGELHSAADLLCAVDAQLCLGAVLTTAVSE